MTQLSSKNEMARRTLYISRQVESASTVLCNKSEEEGKSINIRASPVHLLTCGDNERQKRTPRPPSLATPPLQSWPASVRPPPSSAMERTITRIKNLKARRKLSLPASHAPPDELRVELSSRVRSLSPGDAAYTAAERLRNGGGAGPHYPHHQQQHGGSLHYGPPSSSSSSSGHHGRKEAGRSTSERRRVQWGPGIGAEKRAAPVGRNYSAGGGKGPRGYPYPRHGSLPHTFKNGTNRPPLGNECRRLVITINTATRLTASLLFDRLTEMLIVGVAMLRLSMSIIYMTQTSWLISIIHCKILHCTFCTNLAEEWYSTIF